MILKDRVLKVYIKDVYLEDFYYSFSVSKENNNSNPSNANVIILGYEDKISIGDDVTIKAGYLEGEVSTIYQGKVVKKSTKVANNERTVALELSETLEFTRIIIEPFKTTKGTPLKSIVEQIIQKSGLKPGKISVPNININKNYTIFKYPLKTLKELAFSYDFYFNIEKGKVNCFKNLGDAVVLNHNSGLLAYELIQDITKVQKQQEEQIRNPKKKITKNRESKEIKPSPNTNYFNASCLYIPDISLAKQVKLEPENLFGIIEKLSIDLSNYDDTWTMNIEARVI
jgi:hypothetical protein